MSPTHRAAVLGRPITHSLSPVLHRAAYRALGLDWSYVALDCGAAQLPALLAEHADWAGFSCTMPLKHAALAVAAEIDPLAAAVGAANTLLPRTGGGWLGANTDVAGVLGALRDGGVLPTAVTILGAGGTAQAVVAALAGLQVRSCVALVRSPARAGALLDTAAALGVAVRVEHLAVDAPALGAALVVSTLPSGAADVLAAAPWRSDQTVLDVVYDPWPTALGAAAQAAGARLISGASMLLHQAAQQVTLMTGRPAPVEAMRASLRAAQPHALL